MTLACEAVDLARGVCVSLSSPPPFLSLFLSLCSRIPRAIYNDQTHLPETFI